MLPIDCAERATTSIFMPVTIKASKLNKSDFERLVHDLQNVPKIIFKRAVSKPMVRHARIMRGRAPRQVPHITAFSGGKAVLGGIGANYPLRQNIRTMTLSKLRKDPEFFSRTRESRGVGIGPQGLWLDSGTVFRVRKKMKVRGVTLLGYFPTGNVNATDWIYNIVRAEYPKIVEQTVRTFAEELAQWLNSKTYTKRIPGRLGR